MTADRALQCGHCELPVVQDSEKLSRCLREKKKKGQSDPLSLCSFHEKEMVAVCVLSLQYMCWSQKVAGGQPGLQTESRNLPSLWSPFDEAVPLMPCVLCCCMVISWCVSGALYIDV